MSIYNAYCRMNPFMMMSYQDENGKYVAVVSRGEAPVAVKGNFTELTMPPKSLAEYREMEAKAKETLARVERRLGELSGVRESIEA